MTREEVDNFIIENEIKSAYTDRPINGRFFECSNGWDELIVDCMKELIAAGWDKRVAQIKEKYGTLRFYPRGCTDEQWDIISKYEELSYNTCEICGDTETAKVRGEHWFSCMCDACWEEHG